MKHAFLVAGARPNFMKIAPLYRRILAHSDAAVEIVHTGQHYDRAMSGVFFEQLRLPAPHIELQVGPGTHGAQTGRILELFERELLARQPDTVILVGDVNSTLAGALAASKTRYADGTRPRIVHVEAGLRSGDRDMPEEINRVLTDALSDLLFTTEISARSNLLREGIADHKIHLVGNVMIDCLVDLWPIVEERHEWRKYGLERGEYGVVTLHRPSNVDDPAGLSSLVGALSRIARRLPLLFPVHPRTKATLQGVGLGESSRLILTDPLGYLEFVSLLSGARIVLTDSGGLQEESTFLNVPCLTLRDNTERPVTVTAGTNRLVGSRPANLDQLFEEELARDGSRTPRVPPLWDGQASERIVRVLQADQRAFNAALHLPSLKG